MRNESQLIATLLTNAVFEVQQVSATCAFKKLHETATCKGVAILSAKCINIGRSIYPFQSIEQRNFPDIYFMFSKQEASKLRQEFWTTFGLYLSPLLSSEGDKINWLNYKTGIRQVAFRMHADNLKAYIAIELSHTDPIIREIYFQQFAELKNIMTAILKEEWTWQLHTTDDSGRTLSRIYKELSPINIFIRDDWPALISFLKPRIIALDEFWNQVKYGFEALQ